MCSHKQEADKNRSFSEIFPLGRLYEFLRRLKRVAFEVLQRWDRNFLLVTGEVDETCIKSWDRSRHELGTRHHQAGQLWVASHWYRIPVAIKVNGQLLGTLSGFCLIHSADNQADSDAKLMSSCDSFSGLLATTSTFHSSSVQIFVTSTY